MRRLLLTLIILAPVLTHSQEIEVEQVHERMDKGKNPGLSVVIPATERNPIKRQWKRRLKDFDNEDVDKSRKNVTGKNVLISPISEFTMNVYTNLSQQEKGVKMTVFFQLSEDEFVDDDHSGISGARELVRSFAIEKGEEALSDKLSDAEDSLEDKQDEMGDLEDDKEDLKETIKDCRETIKEAEEALEKNKEKQNEQKEIIKKKTAEVEKIEERLNNLD